MRRRPRVAVIGAGPAGALCAHTLVERGVEVTVFDKGRRPGGRLSTRDYGEPHFDHGAQYMTFRDPSMMERARGWARAGALARWHGLESELAGAPAREPKTERWVGAPSMRALVDHLLADVPCRTSARVDHIGDAGGAIEIAFESLPPARFDRVIVAVPATQATPLVGVRPELAALAASVEYSPCWALMADLSGRIDVAWASARPADEQVAWIARNQTKPGRPPQEAWVVHATPAWSREHFERDAADVAADLWAATRALCGLDRPERELRAHRWRYALVERAAGVACAFDGGIGLCGDGLLGGRVESALLSGQAMAGRVLDSL